MKINLERYENGVWVVGAFILYLMITFGGINILTNVMPYELPTIKTASAKGMNGTFYLCCKLSDPINNTRSYLILGDNLYCSLFYVSEEYEQLDVRLSVFIKTPSRQTVKILEDAESRKIDNENNIPFWPEFNETGRFYLTSVIYPKNSGMGTPVMYQEFKVHTIDEMSYLKINLNLVFVMLLTGSLAVFPAIYYLRKLSKGE